MTVYILYIVAPGSWRKFVLFHNILYQLFMAKMLILLIDQSADWTSTDITKYLAPLKYTKLQALRIKH